MAKALAVLLLLSPLSLALAATNTVLKLDTERVAEQVARAPAVFALALPLPLDASRDGEWSLDGDTLRWRHAIVVDGAKALAMELDTLELPAGATLQIGAETWQGPLSRSPLFTHHQPGTRLALEATLPRDSARAFVLRAMAVQAAFRNPGESPGPNGKASACSVNYACVAEGAVQQWGGSVVALMVMNSATCTGTLMNNSAGDGKPYLLTAKHCYTSTGTTDAVRAAASLRMAWNAVASCGSTLASAWGAATPVTEGASHRAAYGDTWLVELGVRPPEAVGPWYAGFDAGDQMPSGMLIGLHNGAALQRQLLSTSAAPRTTVTNAFFGGIDLHGWGFAPERGAAMAGSSGSGLFDAQGHLIGTLSTGVTCDVGTPQVTYARLAQAWIGDGTSGGSLRSWLDPLNTGAAVAGKSFAVAATPVVAAPSPLPSPPVTPAPVVAAPAAAASGGGAGGGSPGTALLLTLLLALATQRGARVLRKVYR